MELPILKVTELINLINTTLQTTMPEVMVEGEISEYRGANRSGHHYFVLKDDLSDLRCVVFAGNAFGLVIEEGMKVVVKAQPNLHNKYGFSLLVSRVQPSGEGELKKALELTKKKLEAEGLFALERKRELPQFPETIGLVTSSGAAAYSDVLDILSARWPIAKVIHAQAGVQGEDAPAQIISALNKLNSQQAAELIILVRGGGSLEDLSVFSDETVVRAVASSRIPVVCAVGHERDTSLAELAADVRANTPTDAAQKAVPDIAQVKQQIINLQSNAASNFQQSIERLSLQLTNVADRLRVIIDKRQEWLKQTARLIESYNPKNVLKKGYSIVSQRGQVISSSTQLEIKSIIDITLYKGSVQAEVIDEQK